MTAQWEERRDGVNNKYTQSSYEVKLAVVTAFILRWQFGNCKKAIEGAREDPSASVLSQTS